MVQKTLPSDGIRHSRSLFFSTALLTASLLVSDADARRHRSKTESCSFENGCATTKLWIGFTEKRNFVLTKPNSSSETISYSYSLTYIDRSRVLLKLNINNKVIENYINVGEKVSFDDTGL